MKILISGSIAFDTLMAFPARFQAHILPEQLHNLNVSFLVPTLRREFGGCAGNIAYNLKLLGGTPLAIGSVGGDFAPYRDWLKRCDIDLRHILEVDGYTAQAFVTTDRDNNQITAFHPGAMDRAHETSVAQACATHRKTGASIALGIVAPNGKQAMLQHAQEFADSEVRFIFDPGQGLPMFSGDELRGCIALAQWVVVNSYESQLLTQKTAQSLAQLATQVDALIVTRGGEGADLYHNGETVRIPCVATSATVDPTGCGDAFRGGLLFAMTQGWDWRTCVRVGSLMGGIKIEHAGTQNHRFSADEFAARYAENFGETLPPSRR